VSPRRIRERSVPRQLTVGVILPWADQHHRRTGRWPTYQSGPIAGTNGETWRSVHNALVRRTRGLRDGTTLADLLAKHRKVRNIMNLLPLSIPQILRWAAARFARYGCWPNRKSGRVPGTDETWMRLDNALRKRQRGLAGGSSLRRLPDQVDNQAVSVAGAPGRG
jgi:hypothetical protein